MVYTENDLIVPALRLLSKAPNGLSTSQLIELLTDVMKPTLKDAKIIPGRNDTYFSQKVRNLTGSHRNLHRKGLATFSNGVSRITKIGISYLKKYSKKNQNILLSLEDQGFTKADIDLQAQRDFSRVIIEEGAMEKRTVAQRRRSETLRNIAVQEFRKNHNDKVFCEACGFDFSSKYGQYGRDFIEVHHSKPIHEMDVRGSKSNLARALEQAVLLCANCHRMVHRTRGRILSLSELEEIITAQNCVGSAPVKQEC